MPFVLRLLYTLCLYLLLPLVLLHLLWRSRRNPDYRKRIAERFGFFDWQGTRQSIWVHAVSVGEVQAAAALIGQLLKQYPDRVIVVTSSTPTGSDRVRSLFGDTVKHCYLPLDLGWSVNRFLDGCDPSIAIMLETEIWPNLYRACGTRKIPLVIANGRLSASAMGSYRYLVSMMKGTLQNDVVVGAQSQADALRFIELGVASEHVQVTGNIKFDISLPDGIETAGKALRAQLGEQRPVWIAASTHAKEDEVMLAAHRRLLKEFPEALLILVPRHPERFAAVAELVAAEGVPWARRSQPDAARTDTSILLGDTMGELMLMFAASDVAFMAGSLEKIGGHNLLEPAALGLPILTGPYVFNAQQIADLFIDAGVAQVVNDADELAAALEKLFSNAARREQLGAKATALIDSGRGSLGAVLEIIDLLTLPASR